MQLFCVLPLSILLLLTVGCSADDAVVSENPTSSSPPCLPLPCFPKPSFPERGRVPDSGDFAYDFVAHSEGHLVTQGTLYLQLPENPADLHEYEGITGSWDLEVVHELPHLGFRTGEGSLAGQLGDTNVTFIDLNPMVADANVILRGAFDSEGNLAGGWYFAGVGGPMRHGTFRAIVRQ